MIYGIFTPGQRTWPCQGFRCTPRNSFDVERYTDISLVHDYGDFVGLYFGLLYPIRIGDVLEDTYRIEHKLGHGEKSAVWLARDIKKQKDGENQGENEYNMQKEIINVFSLRGCKGDHWVLIFNVRGPNFYTTLWHKIAFWPSYSAFENFSMATRISTTRNLLKALECLHNTRILHNDLNPENVMWGYLGRPLKIALASDLWRQGEPVKAASVPLRLLTDQVYIGDFSLATKAGTDVRHKVLSPLHIGFYAPERFHDVNPSFASDMWSYTCFCSELSFGFVPWQNGSFSLMITKMVGVLGGCYNSYLSTFGKCDYSWYDQCRKPNREATLESMMKRELPHLSLVERSHVLDIISKVFCYPPEDHLSATQLLQDPSFHALMEIHCR
ncbi:Protein kinase-like domain containing protein [Elaphomyces granulatus]